MERSIWMICVTHMFVEVNLLVQVALIPVLINEFRLSLIEASLIATVPSIVQLLMNVPSGFMADHFGPKRLFFSSMMIEGFSAILVSQTASFWALVLGVSLLKISSPLYHMSGLSQISRIAKPQQISRAIGYHNSLGNVGTAAGLVTLTVCLSTLGWRWTYLFWAFPVLTWGVAILISKDRLEGGRSERVGFERGSSLKRFSLILSSGLLVFLVAIAIREIGATGSSTFMTTYFVESRGLSEATASLIFGFGPFLGIVGSLWGGYLSERVGDKKALAWATLGCAIFLFALTFASSLYLIGLIYAVYSFFSSSVWAPMNTIVATLTPEKDRGLSYSVYFLTEGAFASIAPTLAAGVIQTFDIWFILPFGTIFLISTLGVLHFIKV